MFGGRNYCWAQQCILRINVIHVVAEPVYPIVKVSHGCSECLNRWYPYLYADNANNAESNTYYTLHTKMLAHVKIYVLLP